MRTIAVTLIHLISLFIIEYFGDGAEASFTEQNLTVIDLACGGLIETPNLPNKSSFKLLFNQTNLKTEQNCLWTFDTKSIEDKYYYLKVKVTLLEEDRFATSGAAIAVLAWKLSRTEDPLSHKELTKHSPTYMSSTKDNTLFLSYTSASNTDTILKSGFLVRVDVHLTEVYTGLNVYKSSPGTKEYKPFAEYHRFSMVVNLHQFKTNFTVNFVDSKKTEFCIGSDTLHVYEIYTKSRPKILARFCGSLTTALSYTSKFPLLSTFSTRKTTTGRGFRISWE